MKKLIITLSLIIPTFVMPTTGSIYAQTDLKKVFDENSTTFDKEPISLMPKILLW